MHMQLYMCMYILSQPIMLNTKSHYKFLKVVRADTVTLKLISSEM